MNKNLQVQRQSNIELLKILAIFMILLSHSVPRYQLYNREALLGYMELSRASLDIAHIGCQFMLYSGQFGNTIFLICSAWFLLESKKVKVQKLFCLEFDVWVISIIWLVLAFMTDFIGGGTAKICSKVDFSNLFFQ